MPSTERALAVVKECGVPLQIGFQRRFDTGFADARRRIAAGELGRLHLLRSVSHDPYPPPPHYIPTCGGQFVDMSIHDIDIARFLTGSEVESVKCSGTGDLGQLRREIAYLRRELHDRGTLPIPCELGSRSDQCRALEQARQISAHLDRRVPPRDPIGIRTEDCFRTVGVRLIEIELQEAARIEIQAHEPRSSTSTSASDREARKRRHGPFGE